MKIISNKRYLAFRGYKNDISKWQYYRKGFIESWAAPGFHKFWQTWNPDFGYFLALAYINFGGSKRKLTSTLGVFLLSGLWHDLMTWIIFKGSFYGLYISFLIIGILVLISRQIESLLNQSSWPNMINIMVNFTLVAISFILGTYINILLLSFLFGK